MYRFAYKYSDEIIFYFDSVGNKYVASGGNLAWRINNPGLVSSHSHFSRANGAIGSCGRYAIFSDPLDGRKALSAWLQSKKYYNSSLKTLAEYYKPNAPDVFLLQLGSATKISPDRKIKSLNKAEFDCLIKELENLCGYASLGNESFSLLPKITAKIENGKDKEDTYLIGDNIVVTKKEAIEWILSHRLDGVIVHERSGATHLRSRPNHCIWNIKAHESILPPSEGKIDSLVRTIGENKPGQCIWGFINGIDNTEEEALKAAGKISEVAGGEQVLSMPNDTIWAPIDFLLCIILKTSVDTSIVTWTVKFLRYLQLLALERYFGYKEGLSDDQIIAQLALKDAMLHLDSNDLKVMENYIGQRIKHYKNEFSRISNLTVLDPDPDSKFKHKFNSECYQKVIRTKIEKYQKRLPNEATLCR